MRKFMIFLHKWPIALFFTGLFFFSGSFTYAESTSIKNLSITSTQDNLLLQFDLKNSFTEKILDAVNSGVKISFSFPIRVYKDRRFWKDKKIVNVTLYHSIKYDILKKEYLISRSWKPEKNITVKTFEDAEAAMNQVDGYNIIPLEKLVKGDLYHIKAKAKLDKLTLPYYMKYLLFFLTFWEFETDWYLVDFEY